MERYNRHIVLPEIGQAGQDKISQSKVLVVGAGGLGCPALQYLAAAGVGTLGIIDFDVVEESNLQRQVLFGSLSIGKNKALAAKKVLQNLNPIINIKAYPEQLTPDNAMDIFQQYDIIVDGSDNFATRYLINDAAVMSKKPFVYGAIYKFEGQVSVFNYQGSATYRCFFDTPPNQENSPDCSQIGVLGVLPGIIGTMQANEVLKIIIGIGEVFANKLYCYNALTNSSTQITIHKKQEQLDKVLFKGTDFEVFDETVFCAIAPSVVTLKEIWGQKNIQWIDVREVGETPDVALKNGLKIPLSAFEEKINLISKSQPKILFCQSGVRSRKAFEYMKKHGIKNCSVLKENATDIANKLSN